MKRKAVLVVSALRGGGAEKFVLNLYKALEKYENYECHILAIEKAVEHDIAGFRVHFASDICNVSKKGWRRLFYKKNVAKAIDEFVINNIGEDALVLSNMLLADKIMSQSKLNVYHVMHSSYTSAFLANKKGLGRVKITSKINGIYKNHPLIFVSKAAEQNYFISFRSKFQSRVIYNPVDIEEICSLSKREHVEINSEYLIHIGRFNRAKRHDRLIKIFSQVQDDNIKLLLLGEGSLRAEVEKSISNYGLEQRVEIIGFKSNPYPYLKNAKGLVLTSDYEGLPTVILEALALQVPVISTNCPGGITEILGKNSNSLCELDNQELFSKKIDDLVVSSDKYMSTINEQFLPQNVAKQYSQLD
ncbi:glycosyl transferase [Photobacterium gaetbulicola]|uniref:Glycosyl transferase n=1 Tax=Photobacterium gaetbulicola TaxID=1295392 RepID=A0A0B9G9D1_9GAMM|nr:glycosyltransferase [Photobacterium gaetbulicola]KHT65303.1 glycosyl transferase [Photobacterium gaetbulicola]